MKFLMSQPQYRRAYLKAAPSEGHPSAEGDEFERKIKQQVDEQMQERAALHSASPADATAKQRGRQQRGAAESHGEPRERKTAARNSTFPPGASTQEAFHFSNPAMQAGRPVFNEADGSQLHDPAVMAPNGMMSHGAWNGVPMYIVPYGSMSRMQQFQVPHEMQFAGRPMMVPQPVVTMYDPSGGMMCSPAPHVMYQGNMVANNPRQPAVDESRPITRDIFTADAEEEEESDDSSRHQSRKRSSSERGQEQNNKRPRKTEGPPAANAPTGKFAELTDEDLEPERTYTPEQQAKWEEMFRKLVRFKAVNGHCRVPENYEDSKLVHWVGNQRKSMSRQQRGLPFGRFDQKRIDMLDSIGFEWPRARATKPGAYERRSWEDMFKELAQFKDVHGHTRVPITLNAKLANWIRNQRTAMSRMKRGLPYRSLNARRIKLMDSIGFSWLASKDGIDQEEESKDGAE